MICHGKERKVLADGIYFYFFSAVKNVESSLEELTPIIVVTIISSTPSKPCSSIFRESDYDSISYVINFWKYFIWAALGVPVDGYS